MIAASSSTASRRWCGPDLDHPDPQPAGPRGGQLRLGADPLSAGCRWRRRRRPGFPGVPRPLRGTRRQRRRPAVRVLRPKGIARVSLFTRDDRESGRGLRRGRSANRSRRAGPGRHGGVRQAGVARGRRRRGPACSPSVDAGHTPRARRPARSPGCGPAKVECGTGRTHWAEQSRRPGRRVRHRRHRRPAPGRPAFSAGCPPGRAAAATPARPLILSLFPGSRASAPPRRRRQGRTGRRIPGPKRLHFRHGRPRGWGRRGGFAPGGTHETRSRSGRQAPGGDDPREQGGPGGSRATARLSVGRRPAPGPAGAAGNPPRSSRSPGLAAWTGRRARARLGHDRPARGPRPAGAAAGAAAGVPGFPISLRGGRRVVGDQRRRLRRRTTSSPARPPAPPAGSGQSPPAPAPAAPRRQGSAAPARRPRPPGTASASTRSRGGLRLPAREPRGSRPNRPSWSTVWFATCARSSGGRS